MNHHQRIKLALQGGAQSSKAITEQTGLTYAQLRGAVAALFEKGHIQSAPVQYQLTEAGRSALAEETVEELARRARKAASMARSRERARARQSLVEAAQQKRVAKAARLQESARQLVEARMRKAQRSREQVQESATAKRLRLTGNEDMTRSALSSRSPLESAWR